MRKGIVPVGVMLAGLLLLMASLVSLSASPAMAGSGAIGSDSSQALAPAAGGQGQLAPRPRTNTPTRTATRTPTRTPTRVNTPTHTPTNTPVPACGLTWREVAAAHPATALYGMEVISANDIWAVGILYSSNPAQMLIEHWDGVQWSIVPSPNVGADVAYLFNVSAVSAKDIWAIGTRSNRTLAIHWDGSIWSIAPTPNPGINENYLQDIAAVSANDAWAVGYYRNGPPYASIPFIAHWDGTTWSQTPAPNTGVFSNVLSSIDAISANDIWAVGYQMDQNAPASQTRTLAIHWNGSSWSVVPTGFFNRLLSVSAVSSNDVWAVGNNELYMISLHWNGSTWSEVILDEPANNLIYLYSVDAISSSDVWAVGYYESLTTNGNEMLIEHWDGKQWTLVNNPDTGTAPNFLNAVAAASATDVWATGYNYTDGAFFIRYSDPCASRPGSSR